MDSASSEIAQDSKNEKVTTKKRKPTKPPEIDMKQKKKKKKASESEITQDSKNENVTTQKRKLTKPTNIDKKQTQKKKKKRKEDDESDTKLSDYPKFQLEKGTEIKGYLAKGQTVLRGVYTIPKTILTLEQWRIHQSALTIHPPPDKYLSRQKWYRPPPPWEFWGEDSESYCVPTQYGLATFGVPDVDLRPHGTEVKLELKTKLWGPDDEFDQILPMQITAEHIRTKQCGGILQMPTSSGKTIQMQHLIANIVKKKTLIISPNVALHNQLRQRIAQFLPGARIGEIHCDIFDVKDKDVIIAMLHTLALRPEMDISALEDIELVLWDEVERMACRCLSRALSRLSHIRLHIGLSATPEKGNGLDVLYGLFMGPPIYCAPADTRDSMRTSVQCLPYYSETTYHTFPVKKLNRTSNKSEPPSPDVAAMLKMMTVDTQRHEAILSTLDQLYAQGRNVLVFIQTVDYGKRLVRESQVRHPELKMIYFSRTLKPTERLSLDQIPHRLIVATYNIAAFGIDFGYLDTLVFATPRRTIMQAVGRLRSFSKWDRQPSLILDVVDRWSIFRSQGSARQKIYREKKFQLLDDLPLLQVARSNNRVRLGPCIVPTTKASTDIKKYFAATK